MSIFKLLKSGQKSLILADDLNSLWAIIADSQKVYTDNPFPRGTDFKIVADFAKKQGATSVLFLRVSDVRELDVKLSSELDDFERKSAIEFAAASNLGDHSGENRISYLDGMLHDFRSGILTSFFDTEDVKRFALLAKGEKLKFLGVNNFKQLLLGMHFSDAKRHHQAFLFLLGSHGLVAIAKDDKLIVRNLPFGIPSDVESEDWQAKVERRLAMLMNKRVTIYAPEVSKELSDKLIKLTNAEAITPADWQQSLGESCSFYLSRKGQKLIHSAVAPPKPKDPKAAGTIIGFFMLGATVLSLGGLMVKNAIVQHKLDKQYKATQAVLDNIKSEKQKLESLERSASLEQELLNMMKKQERISKNFMLVMNLLSRYPLQYSKILKVTEQSNGIFIEGESVWQPDLSKFSHHFEEELGKYGLSLFSDGLEKRGDGKILFKAHITGGGR